MNKKPILFRPPFSFDTNFAVDPGIKQSSELQTAKSELAGILGRLDACCLPEDRFQWPKENDLERLDELVFKTSLLLRPLPKKQKPRRIEPWHTYHAVDHRWPKLHLCRRIEQLLKRARDKAPQRPLEVLWRSVAHRKLVAELFDLVPKIRKGLERIDSVDWERFAPLFLSVRNEERQAAGKSCQSVLETRLGDLPGSLRLIAYAVYLEIDGDDKVWARRHWRPVFDLMSWVESHLRKAELMRILERFHVGYNALSEAERDFGEMRQDANRKAANERKRRERARKAKESPRKA